MMKKTTAGLTLLLAACGGNGEVGLDLPDDPSAVILIVEDVGGFAPLEFLLNRPPRLVLTGDRQAVIEGPVPAIFPGPLLPNLQVVTLDEETFLFVLEEIETVGLPEMVDERNDEMINFVADATTTRVTFFDRAGPHRFSVYALELGTDFSDERAQTLANLVTVLTEEAVSSPSIPFEGDRVQVFAGLAAGEVEPGFESVQPWPLPDAFEDLEEVLNGWRCAVYEGEQAASLMEVFAQANQVTRWEEAGVEYTLLPRPLVPGETPCHEPELG